MLPPAILVPDDRLFALAARLRLASRVLVWMIGAGPGYLGYGASLAVDRSQEKRRALLRNRGDAGQRHGAPQ